LQSSESGAFDVPDPAVAGSATQDYRGEPPTGTPPERVRVALVGGSGGGRDEDLYRLLRRRLLIAIAINSGFASFASLAMIFDWAVSGPGDARPPFDGIDFLVRNWGNEVFLISSGTLAFWLWRSPPATVRGLRVAELALIGVMTVVFTVAILLPARYANLEVADLQATPVRQAFVWEYAASVAADWMLWLILYAVLIPNTWRRCAIMTGLMGAIPIVAFAVYSSWVRPLPTAVAVQVLTVLAFNFTATVAVVVFASSRIEHFRQQAAEARKLGQYVLREKLGEGGMGEVYLAQHVLLRRPCALKLIRPERAGDPKNLRRFEREVHATAALTHPNTVQVYDYGHTADGTFYYVMEYLPGLTLEALVNQAGPLPLARAIHFLRQICGASPRDV
jgi:serine/threonine-protein kinase